MKILVVGSGGREHALLWKLRQSPRVTALCAAPGNGGTGEIAENVPLAADDLTGLAEFAAARRLELTVVGPEAPLVAGIADLFRARGLPVLGPGKDGARLEGSKVWAKEFMRRHRIPTAPHRVFTDARAAHEWVSTRPLPLVVKADGLAAGKGVRVCATRDEARGAVEDLLVAGALGGAGRTVLVEDCLAGEELSLLVLTDGARTHLFAASQDHKRVGDGDTGPNTGGMGAYAPAPRYTPELARVIEQEIVEPTLDGLRREGIEYRGVLYFGLMLTSEGPQLLEYNCRFGDPETQAVLPLAGEDLAELLGQAAAGRLPEPAAEAPGGAALCVVLASGGYPGKTRTGLAIAGLAEARSLPGVEIFHAGTRRAEDGSLLTAGGRVLGITGRGPDLAAAATRAYAAIGRIAFEGMNYRRDIGARALGEVPSGTVEPQGA